MPKGKTNAPLVVDVWYQWIEHPAVAALKAAGHDVRHYGEALAGGGDRVFRVAEPDWIMHPAAGWSAVFFARDDEGNYPFVQARLKAERARKKAGK